MVGSAFWSDCHTFGVVNLVIALAIGIFDSDANRLAFVSSSQAISLFVRTVYRLTITLPLELCIARQVVTVCYRGCQQFAYFGIAINGGKTRMVTWLRIGIRRGLCVGNRIRLGTRRRFRVFAVIFIRRLDANFVAQIVVGQRVAVLRRVVDGRAIAQPLILDAGTVETVIVFHRGGEGLANLRLARDADRAIMIGLRLRVRRSLRVGNRIRLAARRRFRMLAVVFVGRLDANLVTQIVVGQRVAVLRRMVDERAIAQPLIFHIGAVETVVVFHGSSQRLAYFRFARDADRAFVVRLRLRRVDRRVVRVILHVQGEGFVVAAAVAVVAGDLQGDGFFVRVVEVFAVFEFQRAVGGHFKAVVAYFVGVLITRVRVGRRQFADCRAVFAFRDFVIVEGDVGRCLVG